MTIGITEEDYFVLVNKVIKKEKKETASQPRRSDRPKPTFKAPAKRRTLSNAVISNDVESIELKSKKPTAEVTVGPRVHPNAMRIVWHLLFKVKASEDTFFRSWTTTSYQLCRALGLKYDMSHEQTNKLLVDVAWLVFTIRKGRRVSRIPATVISTLDEDSGEIRLKLNKELKPYLLDLHDYRKIYPCILKLRSWRHMQLYQFLRRYVGLRHIPHTPLPLLQRVMQAEDVPWKYFRRDHLDPAIRDLKTRTELRAEYEVKRVGDRPNRRQGEIDALIFEVRERKRKPLPIAAEKVSNHAQV